jgi:hypothetical protein
MAVAMRIALVALALTGAVVSCAAQTDEIQVYDGSLAKVKEFTLALHTNYVVSGIDTPAFPGAVVADHSLSGVPELAHGVSDWFEAGLYLPVWSLDAQSGFGLDGVKRPRSCGPLESPIMGCRGARARRASPPSWARIELRGARQRAGAL